MGRLWKNVIELRNEWTATLPIRDTVGPRIAFVARFLGRRPANTYEGIKFVPGFRLVTRITEGSLPLGGTT